MAGFKVCLTGGIASGKTYVSDLFSELGAHVIDADILARRVVEKDSIGLSLLVAHFGQSILSDQLTLDRKKLKSLVFEDQDKLALLNSILHPLIREMFTELSMLNKHKLEVWVVPLYQGGGGYDMFERVLAIDVAEEIQLQRVIKRDGVSLQMAKKIIASQPSRELRLSLATDVIANNGDLVSLSDAVRAIMQMFVQLSNQHIKS